MDKLIIIGAGGHGKVVADIADATGKYTEIAFLDDGNKTELIGFPVVGKLSDAEKYVATHDFFVAIGNADIRSRVMNNLLKINAHIASLIHPYAIIGKAVRVGVGTVIMAGAVINPDTVIGHGCIINTSSSVDHDCSVGDFSHVSVGAHIAGEVQVGACTWIGAGATVSNKISICAGCMIGAGAVVVKSITEPGTYVGVPATKK